MKKVVCIESETIIIPSESISWYSGRVIDSSIKIEKEKLYYVVDIGEMDDKCWYSVYYYDTAEHIGCFSSENFGSYELWIAQQRDKKIDEILNG